MLKVGSYKEKYNKLTGQSLPCTDIYQSSGLAVHVQKHHPNETHLISDIPLVIASPDYVGHHPGEPDSVEFVKVLSGNVMVCVKLDVSNNSLYVASVFSISNAKLQKRVSIGRLKKV